MAVDWYYEVGGNKLGPVPVQVLQQLVSTGQVGGQTPVWCEGMPRWVAALSLPILAHAPAAPAGGAMHLVMPVGPQSSFAITAGYLGLFSFVMILAPLAILFGVLGLRDIRSHPEKRGVGRAWTGLVLGSIWLIVLIVLLVS